MGIYGKFYSEIDLQQALNIINANNLGYTGNDVKVAVLDTGIDPYHPLINGRVIKKIQIAQGNINDAVGHGTHVASIILAVAPGVKLINCKVLDDNEYGTFDQIMQGIEAVANKADIINMSLGVYMDCMENAPICKLCDTVANNGVMIVASAGNGGPFRKPSVPALARNVISVGGYDNEGLTATFSSRGPSCGRVYPDCIAPAEGIKAAFPPNYIKALSGTSMAAPFVSGMLALLKEKFGRALSRDEIEYILKNSCKRLDSRDKSNTSGWGLIDIKRALEILEPQEIETPIQKISPLIVAGVASALIYALTE